MDTPALVTVTQRLCPDHSQTLCITPFHCKFCRRYWFWKQRHGQNAIWDKHLVWKHCHYKEKCLRSCNCFTCFSNNEPVLIFPVRNARNFRRLPNLQSTSLFFSFEKNNKTCSIKSLSLQNLLVDVTHSKRHQSISLFHFPTCLWFTEQQWLLTWNLAQTALTAWSLPHLTWQDPIVKVFQS